MKNRHTLISLFAGAGGLDIGLELAGFSSLAVNELENHACETLRQNKILSLLHPSDFESWLLNEIDRQKCYANCSTEDISRLRERLQRSVGVHSLLKDAAIIHKDIRQVRTDEFLHAANVEVGELTLVAGGPPCQPFSRSGKRETVETEDGRLFMEFVRVVREARPRWFLFENVKGLAQSKTSIPYLICQKCNTKSITSFALRNEVISDSNARVICPNCGVVSNKIEMEDVRGGSLEIILNEFRAIGYKCYYKILNAADFGVPQSRERLFIVGSRDGEKFKFPVPTHCENFTKLDSQMNLFQTAEAPPQLQPWRTVKDTLWEFGHPQFGMLDPSKALIWVKNLVRPHAEPVTWALSRPSPTVGAHQGAKLAIAPEGVPEEQLLRQQWHTKGKRQSDLPPVYVKHAMLSDEDLLRLQTFPAEWYLFGTRMQRAFQIGNAVPPLLAKTVGEAILEACNHQLEHAPQSLSHKVFA